MAKTICECGTDHATIKATPELWNACELLGYQVLEADGDEPAERYEVRNCPTGGTMYLLVWSSSGAAASPASATVSAPA